MLTDELIEFYNANGYVVVPGLFSQAEVADLLDHYMTMRKSPQPRDDTGVDIGSEDPIKRYPRMIQPQRHDERTRQWMLDPRLKQCLMGLLGNEPYAAQTMVYFKPAGSRGQALHQDNYYLRVAPGTCMAAWLALDDTDDDNGCMRVVPGSHTWDILCTIDADTKVSFTSVTVPLAEGQDSVPVYMKAGDVLFFNGSIVHGSHPNKTADRFRRALVGHYVEGTTEQVSKGYQPLVRMDGSMLELPQSQLGGATCGVWVEQDGTPAIEMSGVERLEQRKGE